MSGEPTPAGARPGAGPLQAFLSRVRGDLDRRVEQALSAHAHPAAPPRLLEALAYAMLGGGKRLRPALVIASGEAVGASGAATRRLVDGACAVEMVHTFSLIHDDLPSLDDDELRRGRPTLHVAFDEATAILAGDALLNLAYEVLIGDGDEPRARLEAVGSLSRAVGLEGMISGQVMDLDAEGSRVDEARLRRIHSLKTGALISACCEIGGSLALARPATIDGLRQYGERLGLAFQIVDDILDLEGTAEVLGKSPGKDLRAGKATYPSLWGVEESRRRAAESVQEACAAAARLPGDPAARERLEEIARWVLTRAS